VLCPKHPAGRRMCQSPHQNSAKLHQVSRGRPHWGARRRRALARHQCAPTGSDQRKGGSFKIEKICPKSYPIIFLSCVMEYTHTHTHTTESIQNQTNTQLNSYTMGVVEVAEGHPGASCLDLLCSHRCMASRR